MKTYCFDLDGTLCTQTYVSPDKVETDPGEVYRQAVPIPERIEKVNQLYDAGHTILIDTARGTQHKHLRAEWFDTTTEQLQRWGVKYHALRVGVKLVADFYIDDRGINDMAYFRDKS